MELRTDSVFSLFSKGLHFLRLTGRPYLSSHFLHFHIPVNVRQMPGMPGRLYVRFENLENIADNKYKQRQTAGQDFFDGTSWFYEVLVYCGIFIVSPSFIADRCA